MAKPKDLAISLNDVVQILELRPETDLIALTGEIHLIISALNNMGLFPASIELVAAVGTAVRAAWQAAASGVLSPILRSAVSDLNFRLASEFETAPMSPVEVTDESSGSDRLRQI